jgi:hypothetical protein
MNRSQVFTALRAERQNIDFAMVAFLASEMAGKNRVERHSSRASSQQADWYFYEFPSSGHGVWRCYYCRLLVVFVQLPVSGKLP